MRVRIDAQVLDEASTWDTLDHIVMIVASGQHLWHIDDPTVIEQSAWIQGDSKGRAGTRNLTMMRKAYTDSIYPKPNPRVHSIMITVTQVPSKSEELRPHDAVKCLSEKVYLLVENAESDRAFIEAVIDAMSRIELMEAILKGWLVVEHLGGFGEVEKRVRQYLERLVGPIRVFVLADSDALYPGHETQTARKVKACCAAHNVPYAILSKRKMENYLPIEALQAAGRRSTFVAYVELSEEQKDHYEMKLGFERDNRGDARVPPEQEHLFAHVRSHILKELCGGFGKEMWKLYREASAHVSERTLRGRCTRSPGEIDDILGAIECLL